MPHIRVLLETNHQSHVRVAGGFTWTGWDYKGEPSPDNFPSINSHFGILDIAGFPKDRFYWFQQLFKQPDPPLVYLLPHWNWESAQYGTGEHLAECAGRCKIDSGNSTSVEVWVFTNADEAELFVNGKSLTRKRAGTTSHASWTDVPYAPGEIEARVYKKGSTSVLASQTVSTTGPAVAIRASIKDGVGSKGIAADNSDVALVQVEVIDSNGLTVPTAAHNITFTVSGPGKLIGTGNGDPSCLVNDKAATRPAFHGLVLGLVQSTHEPGKITVSAQAQGLQDAQEVVVQSSAPPVPQLRL